MWMWPLAFGVFPFINLVARWGKREDGAESLGGESGILVGIAIVLVLAGFANLTDA